MATLDFIDRELVKLLEKDAEQSCQVLADQLMASTSTVRRRKKRLLQSGALHIVAHADPPQIGLPVVVVIGFDVAINKLDATAQKLASREEVRWLSTTSGRFDIIAVLRFASTGDLYEFSQKYLAFIEGLRNSEIFICLSVKRAPYVPV